MRLLAIETSTDACSVALMIDEEIRVDHRLVPQKHAALVLPMVDALMSESGITASQLDGIAFGRGPGSFTGVRIGVAVTQGIALGADVGVLGVSSLQCMAQGVYRRDRDGVRYVAACLDARMSEVYFGAFQMGEDGLAQPLSQERVCAPEAVAALRSELPQPMVWAGSGVSRYADVLLTDNNSAVACVVDDCWPEAQDLLAILQHSVDEGTLQSAEEAMPVYLRNKVAETTAERESAKAV